jgi:GTP-binding protein HflX
VDDVLEEIGANDAPRVLVLCKADLIDETRRAELRRAHRGAVLVSSLSGEGIDQLTARIEDEFARTLQEVELLVPYGEAARLAELHDLAGDLEREDTPEGTRVKARLPVSAAERFARFSGGATQRA